MVGGNPDISVIIVAYNDGTRLPVAVTSVLDQALPSIEVLIVDDGSTDGTGEVAEELAARHPTVRAVRLPVNSGSSGRPRNVGLDLARAPYVMFLDSDDRCLPDACATLLATAEQTSADVVAGRTVRVNADTGRQRTWQSHLYDDAAVIDDIAERPAQIDDTIVPGKLIRRTLLTAHNLRLPEDILFGDLFFMTQVYCVSTRTVIVPTTTYHYMHHDRPVERPSITRSRHELHNLRSRMEVNRRLTSYLAGRADLLAVRARRFVSHDLWLYAAGLAGREPAYQREFMRLAADHLGTIDLDAVAGVDRMKRLLAFMVERSDLDEVLNVAAHLRRQWLATTLHEDDGRVYWTSRYLDRPGARELLDVTDLGVHTLPFPERPLYAELTRLSVDGRHLSLAGRVVNQLGALNGPADLSARLLLRSRDTAQSAVVPMVITALDTAALSWAARLDLRSALRMTTERKHIWDISLELSRAGETNEVALWCDRLDPSGHAASMRARGSGRGTWRITPYRTRGGGLAVTAALHDDFRASRRVWPWLPAQRRPPATAPGVSTQA
jgi:CDP-glycerol glycerophosphotransferase